MAFKLKRFKKTESLELVNEEGATEKVITVRLDKAGLAMKASKKYVEIQRLQAMAEKARGKENAEELVTKLGQTVIDFFEIIFGEEDTKAILEFYEGNYIEMALEVMPFIQEKVLPTVRAIAQQNRRTAMTSYLRPLA